MGTMNFLLPPDLPAEACEHLERACVVGGPDRMPSSTQVAFDNGQLIVSRNFQESGALQVPWEVPGVGRLLFSSGTLMERKAPYDMTRELARGKLNQVRCQGSEWLLGGLTMSGRLAEHLHQATHCFGETLMSSSPTESSQKSQQTLALSCVAAEELVSAYVEQVFQIRHARQPKFESLLGCRMSRLPQRPDLQTLLPLAFNAVTINVPWRAIEPNEADFRWQPFDELLQWAQNKGMAVVGGPLIDFSGYGFPDWVWAKHSDLTLLCDYLCEFVAQVVRRYKGKVNLWQLTAGSNVAGALTLSEDELLWLTFRIVDTAKQADSTREHVIGLAQPFGDYLAYQERSHSPFAFADNLLRAGAKLGAIDLEFIMGTSPRGSYCRDLLDASRLIDLYSFLGVPLQITLGYPSSQAMDPQADKDHRVGAGYWHAGFTPHSQAEWAQAFAGLAMCKPGVRAVQWCHLEDAAPHQFPNMGLVDATGGLKPALDRLLALRGDHLK